MDMLQALELAPHPEGGYYRETWRSSVEVTLPDGRVRPTATLIYFALPAGVFSAWHKVASAEIWIAHQGVVSLQLGGTGDVPVEGEIIEVGVDVGIGQQPQGVVPAGVWQRTLPGDSDALVSCLVSPGFDFEDFELE